MIHKLAALFALIVAASAAAQFPANYPVAQVITDPDASYADAARSWQGIPGIERTKNGRLWVTWYSGDTGEGDMGNYALAATSADEGKTWSKPMVIVGSKGTRIGDPLPWIDPRGAAVDFLHAAHQEIGGAGHERHQGDHCHPHG